ncbi:hypothetical protein [Curtobacterium sp. MCSS17_016]|uniref:hypothetical protein n=1 Tax=Curtobacterium sp. MCSS17_016 TaxID=2175644 RepID=UPI000DA8A8EC|nr:hypothetical protein [Curtobacterium sp. MCSS17_016]WIE81383.1 hypothetical protein DEJ19_019300 [Curtobacterium sp. MCSS17_016]
MTTTINVLHAIVHRRLWFNLTLAVLTIVAYAAQISVHSAGMSSFWTTATFGVFHSVVFGAWFMYQPKRNSSRHRRTAA